MNQSTSQSQNNDYFHSFDLGCCAALVSVGYELVSLDKSNPKKVRFVFRKSPQIDDVVQEYWNDSLMVNAQAFFNAVKRLKNQIYSN